MLPGLIVRVISKKVHQGRLYNKKLRVTDVLSSFQFAAVDPENPSQLYDDLREKDLETVMPKNDGDSIAVLKGEFKGEVGKLISRDRKKDEVVIQVGMDLATVTQDECCALAD